MKNTASFAFAIVLLAGGLVGPAAADLPGNWSGTIEYLQASSVDFKDGVGIYDSGDPTNTFSICVLKVLGLRFQQLVAGTWEIDQNMGTNLNFVGAGISDRGLGKPGGIDTMIPCPAAIGGTDSNIFITFHGMNWRSAQADSSATLTLCTQKVFATSSPGCLAFPSASMRLWVSACGDQAGGDPFGNVASRTLLVPAGTGNQPDWATANFGGDYTDAKGKYLFGEPWGTLAMKSDVVKCPVRKTVDYTTTIQDFNVGGASQMFELIKNEAVVHASHGTTYMVVCWQIQYWNFSNPFNPTLSLAQAHDWKLIIDLNDPDNTQAFVLDAALGAGFPLPDGPSILGGGLVDALEVHYTGARVGDNSVPGPTVALRGFYSLDAGDPKDGGSPDGQNGFGPCGNRLPDQTWDSATKLKKPTPLI